MRRTRAYITNFTVYSYDKAKEFVDEKVYLTRGFIDLHEMDELEERMRSLIDESDAADYMIFSGNNLLCVIAAKIWIKKHGYINVLQWDAPKGKYNHHVIRGEQEVEAIQA